MKKHRDIPHLTIEQIKQLLEAESEPTLKTLLTLAITTGMRLGELRGLRWQDIDGENEIVHIRRRVVSGNEERAATETARTIALPILALYALKELQQHQEKEHVECSTSRQDLDLVFPDEVGQHINSSKLYQQYHAVFTAIGLPHLHFHDLRHNTAVFFIEREVNVAVIQAILGFRYRSTTLNTLTPVSLSMQKEAMLTWDLLLSGTHGESPSQTIRRILWHKPEVEEEQ